MRKLELLSPACDMERLKMAVLYGADAVYLAGLDFVQFNVFGVAEVLEDFAVSKRNCNFHG